MHTRASHQHELPPRQEMFNYDIRLMSESKKKGGALCVTYVHSRRRDRLHREWPSLCCRMARLRRILKVCRGAINDKKR